MSHSPPDLAGLDLFQERAVSSLYDECYDQLLSMPSYLPIACASYKYNFFKQVEVYNDNISYVASDRNTEYKTILIGQIVPEAMGTKFSAKGTHYISTVAKPNFIDDKTKVKCCFNLAKPTLATERLALLFDNQLATLGEIVDEDRAELARQKKDPSIKEWTCNLIEDGSPHDFVTVHTEPIYTVPKSCQMPARNKKRKLEKRPLATQSASDHVMSDQSQTDPGEGAPQITDELNLNTTYAPSVLPDYGGDLFNLQHARLRQLDLRDEDNNLIKPNDWYDAFRPGTLVLARATLHGFVWDNRRVYQIIAHSIRILSRSPCPAELRIRPNAPMNAEAGPSTTSGPSVAAKAVTNITLGKRKKI